MVAADGNLVMLNQFENQQNCDIHYRTTGKEIINEIGGEVDYFIAGVGTGGTITGIARSLRESCPDVRVIGIQPMPGEKIEGLKSVKDGYVPPILCPSLPCADHSKSLIDIIIDVDSAGAFAAAKDLARKEGLFVGASSGAAMAMAIKYARKIEKGVIVTVFPDRGEKYLSTEMFAA
jgi:cysteine synthase